MESFFTFIENLVPVVFAVATFFGAMSFFLFFFNYLKRK